MGKALGIKTEAEIILTKGETIEPKRVITACIIIVVVIFGGWTVKLIGQNQKQKQTIHEFQVREQKQNEQLEKLLEEQRVLKEQKQKLEKEKAELQKQVLTKSTRKVAYVNKPMSTGACYTAMKQVFPQSQWANATAVIKGESGGNQNARHLNSNGTVDSGCFQLNRGEQSWGRAVYDPLFNAQKAYKMYCARGWSPWVVARKLGIV